MPRKEDATESVFKLSNGARRFLRYGYGDLFQKDRKYDVLFRIWPGTQRTLLWGDPALAAGIGNSSHFCGAAGVDISNHSSSKAGKGLVYREAGAHTWTKISTRRRGTGRNFDTRIEYGAAISTIRVQIEPRLANSLRMNSAALRNTSRLH